jgi:hypothetical protein
MLIAVASAKGAPGTTTSALALALTWPRPVILADLDARCGDLMLTFGQGQDTGGRGVLGWQVTSRREPAATALWSQLIELPGPGPSRWLLPGIGQAQHAGSVDWTGLAGVLGKLPVDVIADCGSVRASQAPAAVWSSADLVVLVLRSTLPSVHAVRGAAAWLRGEVGAGGVSGERLGALLVGPARPYSSKDVAASLAESAPLVGEVPWDPKAAALLETGQGESKRLVSSALLRGATQLARTLAHAEANAPAPGSDRVTRGETS